MPVEFEGVADGLGRIVEIALQTSVNDHDHDGIHHRPYGEEEDDLGDNERNLAEDRLARPEDQHHQRLTSNATANTVCYICAKTTRWRMTNGLKQYNV